MEPTPVMSSSKYSAVYDPYEKKLVIFPSKLPSLLLKLCLPFGYDDGPGYDLKLPSPSVFLQKPGANDF